MKVKIVPTILTQNFSEFKKRLKTLEPFFTLVQIDCADGKFVKNKTFYHARKVKSVKSKVNYELHLMIEDPLKEIKKWVTYRRLRSVIFHYEAVKSHNDILNIIGYLHKKGIKAGLAINPGTKIEKIIKLLPLVDTVLIMGVNPGWGGQKIRLKVVKSKVYKIRKIFPKLDIEVDGGVNSQNADQIVRAGANILAVGNSLNSESSIKDFVNKLR